MKLQLFENLFIEGELFQCQLPTLHEANPRSSCSKVFILRQKTQINQPPFQGLQHGVQYVEAIPDARG